MSDNHHGTAIRRIISECDDMVVIGSRSYSDDYNGNNNNDNIDNNNERAGDNIVVNSTNFVRFRGNDQGAVSDLTITTPTDPMDTNDSAPIRLIEGSHIVADDKFEDNSSLSCDDDSDETPTDLNNMILLHERPQNNNNNAATTTMTMNPTNTYNPNLTGNNNYGDYQYQTTTTTMMPNRTGDDTYQRMDSSDESNQSSQRAPSSLTSDWGFFEDVHQSSDGKKSHGSHGGKRGNKNSVHPQMTDVTGPSDTNNDAAAMAVTAPNYVLEESISSQLLWKHSAGQRPPQPIEERAFYEKMWVQNFARSQVNYRMPVEVLTSPSPISLNPYADGNFEGNAADDHHVYATTVIPPESGGNTTDVAEAALANRMHIYPPHALTVVNKTVKDSLGEGDLTVLVRGDNVFGTTVSKSFARTSEHGGPIAGVDTVNISVASYRVVENKKHVKYAQFLVIYREGSIRDTVGIWKRYRDFEELANKVTQAHEGCSLTTFANNLSPLAITHDEPETEHLPNAITSWRLLKKRQRWYRCLDAGYLSLKVFLLERFLHDILFESSSPQLLRDFVGVDSNMF